MNKQETQVLTVNALHLQIMTTAILVELNKDRRYKVTAPWPYRDVLMIAYGQGTFANIGDVEYLQVSYGECTIACDDTESGAGEYFACNTQYFPTICVGEAIGCFIQRLQTLLNTDDVILVEQIPSWSLEEIAQGHRNSDVSYDLNNMESIQTLIDKGHV